MHKINKVPKLNSVVVQAETHLYIYEWNSTKARLSKTTSTIQTSHNLPWLEVVKSYISVLEMIRKD